MEEVEGGGRGGGARGKRDVFVALGEEEQWRPNEYYELASKANKPKRKRASKGYTKEKKEESEW